MKLYMITPNYFIMTQKGKTRAVTSVANLCAYAEYMFEIQPIEIMTAISEMKKHNHNYSEFGIVDRHFVYSKKIAVQ